MNEDLNPAEKKINQLSHEPGQVSKKRNQVSRKVSSANKKASRKAILLLLALLAAIAGLWYGYLQLDRIPALQVRTIVIDGNQRCDLSRIEQCAGQVRGKSLLKIDLADLHSRITGLPWVKQVILHRIWPNTLSITIKEHEPFALLKADQIYLLALDGAVIMPLSKSAAKSWDLPLISGVSDIDRDLGHAQGSGFKVQDSGIKVQGSGIKVQGSGFRVQGSGFNSALEILQWRQKSKAQWLLEVTEIKIRKGQDLVLANKKKRYELRLGHDDLARKIQRLNALLTKIEAQIVNIDYIDVRYQGQIIVKPDKCSS